MQINQRKAGIVLNYLGEAIKILTALIYTPIMLRLLGQSEYGLYQLVSSTVAYLSLLSLGFGSAYVRYYSKYRVKEDNPGIAKLNGMFISVFCAMAMVCLLCGIVMVANAQRIFGTGLTAPELEKAKILLAILIVNMALTFPNSVFNCYITAHEQFVFQRLVTLVQNILNPFLTLPLLLLGYGSVAMVLISTFLTVLSFGMNIYFCSKKLKMKFVFKGMEFSLLKEMSVFTFFIFLNQIIDQINWNVDKFILGRVSGTAAVAIYGVGGQINNLYMSLTNKVAPVYVPEVNRIVMENSPDCDKRLSVLLNDVGRVTFILCVYIFVGFLFCGKNFVQWWAGAEYVDAYYVSLLLIAPLTFSLPHSLGIEIRRAKNQHQIASVIMLLTTIGNMLISIPLSIRFGAIGAAAGTFFCLIINQTIINIYYVKIVKLNLRILHESMIAILKSVACPVLFGVFGMAYTNLYVNILWAIAYTALYIFFVYRCAINEAEKKTLMKAIVRMRGTR